MYTWYDILLELLLAAAVFAVILILSKKWENQRVCRVVDDRAAPKVEGEPVAQDDTPPFSAEKSRTSSDKISVIVKSIGSGETFVIKATPSDQVMDVKLKIQEIEGTAVDFQRLIFCARSLQNQLLLKNCGVVDGSVMHFVKRTDKSHKTEGKLSKIVETMGSVKTLVIEKTTDKFSVIVEPMGSEETLVIEALPADRVMDLKLKIQEITGTPLNLQRLIFCGRPMKNKLLLKSCGVVNDSVIHFVTKNKHSIQVAIKTLKGTDLFLECDENDKVEDLKRKIEVVDGCPYDSIRLIFAGKQLEDARYLRDYNITEDSTIHMALRLRGGFVVYIRISDGSSLNLYHFDTIIELKQKIHKETGIEIHKQELFFNGTLLKDECRREDYNIIDQSTIDVIIQNDVDKE